MRSSGVIVDIPHMMMRPNIDFGEIKHVTAEFCAMGGVVISMLPLDILYTVGDVVIFATIK